MNTTVHPAEAINPQAAVSEQPVAGASERFHIISITLRRYPGDRAYAIRESFNAESLEEACANHAAFKQSGVRCYVLRDGKTGARYSLEQSRAIAGAQQ